MDFRGLDYQNSSVTSPLRQENRSSSRNNIPDQHNKCSERTLDIQESDAKNKTATQKKMEQKKANTRQIETWPKEEVDGIRMK